MAFKRPTVVDDEGDGVADHLRQVKARCFRLEDHGAAHPALLNDVQVSHLDVNSEEDAYSNETGQNFTLSTSTGSPASQVVNVQRKVRTVGGIKLTADVVGRLASTVLAGILKKGTPSVDQDLQHLLILSLLHADCPAAMLTQEGKGDDTEDMHQLLTWDDVYLYVHGSKLQGELKAGAFQLPLKENPDKPHLCPLAYSTILSQRFGLTFGNLKEAVQEARTQSDGRLRWRRPETPLIAGKSSDGQSLVVGSPSTEEVDMVVMHLGMAAGALLDTAGAIRFATEPFEAVFRRPSLCESKLIEQWQRWRDEAEEEPERPATPTLVAPSLHDALAKKRQGVDYDRAARVLGLHMDGHLKQDCLTQDAALLAAMTPTWRDFVGFWMRHHTSTLLRSAWTSAGTRFTRLLKVGAPDGSRDLPTPWVCLCSLGCGHALCSQQSLAEHEEHCLDKFTWQCKVRGCGRRFQSRGRLEGHTVQDHMKQKQTH